MSSLLGKGGRKTVLITGASRGIGAAAARTFASAGYNVAINYNHSHQAAREVKKEIALKGGSAEIYQADVSEEFAVKAMIQAVVDDFGYIDVLVNNAGIAGQKLFSDITREEWERMFAVNVTGSFLCSKYAVQGMLACKSGKIINVSSIWGITGASCEVHYSASKAAIIGFTKALAKELGPSNIQINCLAPGVIETDMNSDLTPQDMESIREMTPLERVGTPCEVAEAILFLASSKADFITGQVLSPNGGIVI